jgi:sugar lactone lactonase YvrE
VGGALCALNARADLLVLNAAGSASYILRLDTTTGAPLGMFRQDTEAYYTMTLSPRNELCVASNVLGEHTLQGFEPDGRYRGDLARNVLTGLDGGMRGPDGAIYAIGRDDTFSAGGEVSSILRVDRQGAKRWVPHGTGGMTAPVTLAFSPAGDLYVGDAKSGVLRFDGATGAPLGVLVPLGQAGLPDVEKLLFGPDGRLYVASHQLNAVLRFDAVSGASVGPWVTPGSGGLVSPTGMAFGPDGRFYVTSSGTNQILRYDGATGAPLGLFATAEAVRGDPRVRWRDLVFVPSIRDEGVD